jgi:MFS family permease
MKHNVALSTKLRSHAYRVTTGLQRPAAADGHTSPLLLPGLSLRRWGRSLFSDDCGTNQLQPETRHNLRWFRLDGIFAQASESIVAAYLTLFVLALGASRAQIGLMSALASLSAALVLLPGAAIAERSGRRKAVVLLGGGGGARVALLLLALVPLAFSGSTAVLIAIALIVLRGAFANVGVPAWMSLTADIVPLPCRGRYFSSRNMAMVLVGMTTTFVVGQLITRVGAPAGHQLALGIAFGFGLVATFSFSRLRESPAAATQSQMPPGFQQPFIQHLRAHPDFITFCVTAGLWNLSLGIAMPFFSVYMVENLGASASMVGLLAVVSALAAMPGQRLFGILADRWGPRRVQLLTGLIIPVVPWAWLLVRSPWHLVPAELAGGFLWAGYTLASFNFLLLLTAEDRRSHYAALYQIAVTLALAGGAALGGIVATHWGYVALFALTGLGRLAAALLFARFVHQPGSVATAPGVQLSKRIRALFFGVRRKRAKAY